jgi:hypothetical protein
MISAASTTPSRRPGPLGGKGLLTLTRYQGSMCDAGNPCARRKGSAPAGRAGREWACGQGTGARRNSRLGDRGHEPWGLGRQPGDRGDERSRETERGVGVRRGEASDRHQRQRRHAALASGVARRRTAINDREDRGIGERRGKGIGPQATTETTGALASGVATVRRSMRHPAVG